PSCNRKSVHKTGVAVPSFQPCWPCPPSRVHWGVCVAGKSGTFISGQGVKLTRKSSPLNLAAFFLALRLEKGSEMMVPLYSTLKRKKLAFHPIGVQTLRWSGHQSLANATLGSFSHALWDATAAAPASLSVVDPRANE